MLKTLGICAVLVAFGVAQAQQRTGSAPPQQPGATAAQPARPAPFPPEGPSAAQVMEMEGGSLMRASFGPAGTTPEQNRRALASMSFFAVPDPAPRTIKKHDLVTIIIREESEFSSDGSNETKKSYDLQASITEFIQLNRLLQEGQLRGGGIGTQPPSVALGGNRDFKGESKVDRSDSFIARITAEVVDVKPNGTFAIQARKRIKTDEEQQEFLLTGICRAADLTVDNTILSTQVYDLNLEKNHSGSVRDGTKRGFVPKLLDFINPF